MGTDNDLNHRHMGTGYLTQASNKRAITFDLKIEREREILRKLVATADVFVENYRPGAFDALGLGYKDLSKINPRLIYASFSAFGQGGREVPQFLERGEFVEEQRNAIAQATSSRVAPRLPCISGRDTFTIVVSISSSKEAMITVMVMIHFLKPVSAILFIL